MTTRPSAAEYSSSCAGYVALVPQREIVPVLEEQLTELLELAGGLSDREADVVHAPYTWSIKQVVGHILDCERIFGYRALRIARADATPLSGFDENEYARQANHAAYAHRDLVMELTAVRRSHISFFRHLAGEAWGRAGIANDCPITVRALAYVLAGHAQHHLHILKKRLTG